MFLAINHRKGAMKGRLTIAAFLFVSAASCLCATAASNKHTDGPVFDGRTAAGWLARASEQMNIRMPGSPPFHMRVVFHASPGWEVLGRKEKPQIITGDGVYDELWLAPHEWRREVTLASYHAIEVESETGRKMQASSDYEPGRVLMLLTALYEPVPRWLLPGESTAYSIERWSMGPVSMAGIPLVTLESSFSLSERSPFTLHKDFYFLPNGPLVMEKISGMLTSWLDESAFGGKVVPGKITIKAPGLKPGSPDRTLLTADVTINAAGQVDRGAFDLPGPAANPGMTLRPLLDRVDELPRMLTQSTPLNHNERVQMMAVLDRQGVLREVEIIKVDNAEDLYRIVLEEKRARYAPAIIDGSPCEVLLPQNVMMENHTDY